MKTRLTSLALAAALAGGLTTTSVATSSHTAEAATTVPAMLIVAAHTDDEATLSAYYTGKPGVRKVFLWVDQTTGASNTALFPGTNIPSKWNSPEWKPSGNLASDLSRSNGKFEGSLRNIASMRRADPSLPAMTYSRPTKRFNESGRAVMTWMDASRGGAIRYGLPFVNVTPEATRIAINDVTNNPRKYGLPTNLRWIDIIAPNYYNWSGTGGTTCDTYANPTHNAINTGVMAYAYPQFSGLKYHAVCKADSSRRKITKVIPTSLANVTHAKYGSLNIFFGWLYRGYGVPLMTTKSGVFSKTQTAIWNYARNGIK